MVLALGEQKGRAARFQCLQHIVEDQVVAIPVGRQRSIQLLDRRSLAVHFGRQPEGRVAQHRPVSERPLPGLGLCAGPEPDRAALHEHDRMVAVPPRDRGGQAQNVFRRRPARHRLEADR